MVAFKMAQPTDKPFILASASPRRKQLLTKAGYNFKTIVSQVDESAFTTEGIAPVDHAMQLALAKAKDVAQNHHDILTIGADTIVDFNGQIIGKPDDAEHAEQITRKLFAQPHKVITALALVWIDREIQIVRSAATTVYPKKMTDRQIENHIRGNSWQGKAGAYAIQETGDQFVDHIEGSFTNVIGLPMELLARLLEEIFA